MYGILNNSKSGMSATQDKIDLISNNIVNSNTTGYKKLEVEFQELLTETLYKDSYPTNSEKALTGTGIKISNSFRNYTQGSLKNTGISSNLAIDGEGYFRVIRNDGSAAYTRNGEFNIDGQGRLVDDSGNLLEIQFVDSRNYGNTQFSNDNLTINKQGQVFVDNEMVGQINLYTSVGDNDYLSVSGNLFIPKDATNMQAIGNINMLQGHIEMANVDLGQEMTELIAMQRAFQFNSKGVQAADDMWGMVNNLQSR